MLFSDASGRKIVSTGTAENVGWIDDFVVDPEVCSVVALKVKKADQGDILAWKRITAFGADALTVPGADAIGDADDTVAALADKHKRLMGKRVLDTFGEDLGPVTDVEFDPKSGRLITLTLKTGSIAGERLLAVGTYATVVRLPS